MLLSCGKDNDGPGINMQFRQDFEIPAGIGVFVVHHFMIPNVTSSYTQLLAQNNKTDADIREIKNISGELSSIFGDGTFEMIQRISVRAYPQGAENDYIEVAYRDPAPFETRNTLGLIPSLADVKPLLKQDRFSFDVVIELRNNTSENIPVSLNLLFKALY
jgi:hypothetical protein